MTRIILGIKKAPYREGGYTLETIEELTYNADGSVESYSNDGFEFLSQDFIDERNDVSYARECEDIWQEAVRSGYTTESLEDWYEGEINSGCYSLYPFDDESYRDEAEEAWENLSKKQKEQIEEYVGVKGELDNEDDRGDWVTFNWVHSHSLGNPEEQDDWVVVFNKSLLEKIVKHDTPYYEDKTCPRCGKTVSYNTPMYWSHSSEYDNKPLCEDCDKELDKLQREKEDQEIKEKQLDNVLHYFKKKATEYGIDARVMNNIILDFSEEVSECIIASISNELEEKDLVTKG